MENLDWIAWAAGLFEGEGCIYLAVSYRNTRCYQLTRLRVQMTDKDVLVRFQEVLKGYGIISISGKPASSRHKQAWQWQCNDSIHVSKIIALFWPYLGERRKAKAIELGLQPKENNGKL